jgi:hypothetical protein
VDLEAALVQRGGDFQPDEARAYDDLSPGRAGGVDDRAAVGERPQVPMRSRSWPWAPRRASYRRCHPARAVDLPEVSKQV